MHEWARDLWTLPRSLMGDGVRDTLQYFKRIVPSLAIHEIPTGSPALDWIVPNEWKVHDAYIEDQNGVRIVDWRENNLSLVGYSVPFRGWISRHELDKHLHSLPEIPEAVPYVTSYYEERWGFCIQHNVRNALSDDQYFVNIDSNLAPGSLSRGEIFIQGESDEEILLTSYICHPMMANNELSGPIVLTALARWMTRLESPWYSYRFLFAPETIGILTYLEERLHHLKENVRAGWVITCVGDDGPFSYIPSRKGGTLSDRVLLKALEYLDRDVCEYSWNDRGSDERQLCAPGIDLPICSFSRSKYGTYPEYHTSLDNLNFISADGLEASLEVMQTCILQLEERRRLFSTCPGEPQMSRRGRYPSLSTIGALQTHKVDIGFGHEVNTRDVMNVLSMCDGDHDSGEISEKVHLSHDIVELILQDLEHVGLVNRRKPQWMRAGSRA